MAQPSRADLLSLALGVLPDPPALLDVISEDGGAFRVALDGVDHDMLRLYAPRTAVRKDLRLLARITDHDRGGYEVELEVAEVFFHSGAEALVQAGVAQVRRRKMRRLAARVPVAAKALGRIVFCRSLPEGSEIDVRVADVSTTGVAFSSRQPLDAGDLIELDAYLAGRTMTIGVRVVRCDPAPYGRFRIGCEITDLAPQDREALAELACEAADESSAAERRPDTSGSSLRAAATGLMQRIGHRDAAA